MTLCLGWKAFGCVFLFADTLISRFGEKIPLPSVDKTSFSELQGELLVYGRKAVVEEGGVKIRSFGNAAITYAGCVGSALAMIDVIQYALELGRSGLEALHSALVSVQPLAPDSHVVILLACHENGEAKLFRLDTQDNGIVDEISGLVLEGSVGECHRGNVQNYIDGLSNEIINRHHPRHHSIHNVLIRITALLQSLGIHNFIVEEGVGGAFVGVCLSGEGIEWQPDTLYIVHPPIPSDNVFFTGVFIREQVVCLIGSASGVNKFIASRLKDEKNEAREKRVDSAVDCVIKKYDAGLFQYLVFLNTGPHVACVIEMQEKLFHELVMIDAESIVEGRVGIAWTESLVRIINQIPPDKDGRQPNLCIHWLPFRPADEKNIAEFKDYLADIREAEFENY